MHSFLLTEKPRCTKISSSHFAFLVTQTGAREDDFPWAAINAPPLEIDRLDPSMHLLLEKMNQFLLELWLEKLEGGPLDAGATLSVS